jgi:hypothetical protein
MVGAALGRVGAGLRWVVATETFEGQAERPAGHYLRFAIALGIVVASISSAVAGVGAELYNEQSTQNESLFRQAVITLQERERAIEGDVASDLQRFAAYEQAFMLGHVAQNAEKTATGRLAERVYADATAQEQLAALDEQSFLHSLTPFYTGSPYPAVDVTDGYRNAVHNSGELNEADPAALQRRASSDRQSAVDLTGVAAVFVFALVLLTVAQMRTSRTVRMPAGRAWNVGATLAVTAAAVWVLGVALAFVVLE